MALVKEKPMTLAEFLAWEDRQPARYEFVGGVARMMTGATYNHDLIVTNITATLFFRLRGSPCVPFGHNRRIPTPETGNSRYPDVVIDCGKPTPESLNAIEPRVVFEVLSKSTWLFDVTQKVDDYSSVASIRQYIVISPSELAISVWQRIASGELVKQRDLKGRDAVLLLHCHADGSEISLSAEEIYQGTGLLDAVPAESDPE